MRAEYAICPLTSEGPRRKGKVGRKGRVATVNLAESPLSWLHAHGHLDDRLFAAGEQLRRDYERAQLSASITMNWTPVHIKGGAGQRMTPTERQLAAKERFDGALAVAGRGLQDILWRVVCAGETLTTAEKGLQWPARSGKLVLRLALDRVADFYRMK
ncbi:hypothetical protein D6851_09700 [Altericroceibacterium spongiae]|uniref:DUF6456 domain-containing protein n=1 Tax=Altericroceibacterium spongiae TaxID=2320269 RepID=A0A420EKG6_9SPHN|nr:DUF6456 domain-containing protein [Altericroceibacterium spongiae]RKF21178.1 hypothetical protein D6851_09700 [Altericroceibacterium spongiae]